ncbi:MAG TPA: vWA domain-containing protein [Planktothrix sp.]|jgi:uncharacterized protein with von Willebrand factor type A (vWA) domain
MNLNFLTRGVGRTLGSLAVVVLFCGMMAACDKKSDDQQQADSSATAATSAAAMAGGVASLDDNDYVIFDGSGSMTNCVDRSGREYSADSSCIAKIDGAKQAVSTAISNASDDHRNRGLYVFDDNGRSERVALGGDDRDAMLKAVSQIQAGDGTPLGPAMEKGARALIAQYNKQLGYGTYRLIVVTDGMPDHMSDVEDALAFIKKSGVPIQIYTIGFGMNDPDHPLRKASVAFTAAYNGEEVQKALTSAMSESNNFDPADFHK